MATTTTTKNTYQYMNRASVYYAWERVTYPTYNAFVVQLPSDVVVRSSVPNYKILIKTKQDASGSYSRTSFNSRVGHISGTASSTDKNAQPHNSWGYTYYLPIGCQVSKATYDDSLRDLALKRLKNKLSGVENHFKALIPLGEIGELRSLVKGMADQTERAIKAIRELRKGHFTRALALAKNPKRAARFAKQAHREVSQAWLSYSFGINPMLEDAKALGEAITTYLTEGDRNIVIRGSATKTWNTFHEEDGQPLITGCSFKVKTLQNHNLRYSYTAGVKLRIVSGNNYTAANHLGFNLTDIPSALWELTAFSWIVDYFTTAGEYLDDVFSSKSSSTIYCTLSTKYWCNTQAALIPVPGTKYSVQVAGGWATSRFTSFNRTSYGELPVRILRVKSVDEIGKNALNRLLNLTSVIGSHK